jgi:hypothetical protein
MKIVLIVLGIALIALSGLALANRGISYTREETVIDIGPIEATAETRETVDVPVWASVAGLILGAGLLTAGVRQRA